MIALKAVAEVNADDAVTGLALICSPSSSQLRQLQCFSAIIRVRALSDNGLFSSNGVLILGSKLGDNPTAPVGSLWVRALRAQEMT
jgi:hypothetical protein